MRCLPSYAKDCGTGSSTGPCKILDKDDRLDEPKSDFRGPLDPNCGESIGLLEPVSLGPLDVLELLYLIDPFPYIGLLLFIGSGKCMLKELPVPPFAFAAKFMLPLSGLSYF